MVLLERVLVRDNTRALMYTFLFFFLAVMILLFERVLVRGARERMALGELVSQFSSRMQVFGFSLGCRV